MSSLGLDFPMYALEMVLGKVVRVCVICGMTSWTQCLPALWRGQGLPVSGVGSSQPQTRRDMLFSWSLTLLQLKPRWLRISYGQWHLYAMSWAGSFFSAQLWPYQAPSLTCCCLLSCLGGPPFSVEHPQPL